MKENQINHERESLKIMRSWIEKQINLIKEKDSFLEGKIKDLKKAAKGSYDMELETSKTLYEITHKNLANYNEAIEKPYFARIDFREYKKDTETFYIGKIGLGDVEEGEEKVIDWRAPIADLYYSGTQGWTEYKAPIGIIEGDLSLKRKFLYKGEDIEDIFDEGINEIIIKSAGEEGSSLTDEFLKLTLEESTGSKLKDVVATIQKEQNDIIRAPKVNPIIVQGSAGSGKTTVALHRLAYLLYRYNNNLKGEDILVIAPNKVFLDYISDVLPSLGVGEVKQITFEELCLNLLKIKSKVITKDKKLADILEEEDKEKVKFVVGESKVKNSIFFKTVLDRYVTLIQIEHGNIESIMVDNEVLVDKKELRRLFMKDMVNLPANKRKDEIKRYLSLKLKDKIIELQNKIESDYDMKIFEIKKNNDDSEDRRKQIISLYDERDAKKEIIKKDGRKEFDEYFKRWNGVSAKDLYLNLFKDENLFSIATGSKIPKDLSKYMISNIIENSEKGIIDSDDLAAMVYLKFKLEEVPKEYIHEHLVIDEAQDYSPLQMFILKHLSKGDSMTIVGDIGQGIYYYKSIEDWNIINKEVFEDKAIYTPLTQSYRSTIEIIEFANNVLRKQQNSLKPAMPVLRHGDYPQIIEYVNNKEFLVKVEEIVEDIKNKGKKSVAIICKTAKECKKVHDFLKKNGNIQWKLIKDNDNILDLENIIIPSYMTKGLEFDCSVIYNCNEENYSDEEIDKRLLYVVLTRALHYEYVFYNGSRSKLLD